MLAIVHSIKIHSASMCVIYYNRKVMFSQAYVKNSVHRRVYSIMQWAGGVHPLPRLPGQTPLGQTHTLARHPPGQTTPPPAHLQWPLKWALRILLESILVLMLIANTDLTRGADVWLPYLSSRKTTAHAFEKQNKTSTNKIEKKTSEKSQVRNKWRWEAISTSNLDSQLINVVHPHVQQFSVSRLKHQIHVAIH